MVEYTSLNTQMMSLLALSDQQAEKITDLTEELEAKETRLRVAEAETVAIHHLTMRQRAAAHASHMLAQLAIKNRKARKKMVSAGTIKKVEKSLLFDTNYYLARNPDVAQSKVSPLLHYLEHGWREGRKPNRIFEPMWYLAMNPDVLRDAFEPLSHYVMHGQKEGRKFHQLFDEEYYHSTYPSLLKMDMSPLAHFVRYGLNEGRVPSPMIAGLLHQARLEKPAFIKRFLHIAFGELTPMGAAAYSASDNPFPPASLDDFWMEHELRVHLVERHGGKGIELYNYLLSVIDHYAQQGAEFDHSEECKFLLNTAKLRSKFLSSKTPDVSIVISAYNNLVYTLTSVISIFENSSAASYEIIIADDCSTDATSKIMGAIGGVVSVVRTPKNMGFLRNCNHAAKSARGKYIMMLNNDTLVLPGWLDPLVETLAGDPKIGLVGSKLLFGNGMLQEAGAIVWKDGTAWNFGRDQNPRMPQYNYVKDVDYISGATIMLPAELWRKLEGFDELYAPAYCEDVDIAFRVRAAGYRTVYQPFSEVVHHEGCSHGTDIKKGVKANQVINLKKFYQRWQSTLKAGHFQNGKNVFLARDRSAEKPHIVIVDHYVPQWDRDTGSRTIYHYIRLFMEAGFHVSLWPDNLHYDPDYAPQLQRMGVEVLYGHHHVGSFAQWLAPNAASVDYVLVSRPHVTVNYMDILKKHKNITRLYYGHDLHYRRMQMQYDVTKDPELPSAIQSMKVLEQRIVAFVDVMLSPSDEETEIVTPWLSRSGAAATIPLNLFDDDELLLGLERAKAVPSSELKKLLFVGGFSHAPNKDGIVWFVQEVLPRIVASVPDIKLSIVGSNIGSDVYALKSAHVDVLGHVSDEKLAELYEQAGISIAPLRYGAGVKGKVVEAMAKGIPVAITSIGAQGLVHPAPIAAVADDPEGFAQAIISAVRDPQAVSRRAMEAVKFMQDNYSKSAARRLLGRYMPELVDSKATAEA